MLLHTLLYHTLLAILWSRLWNFTSWLVGGGKDLESPRYELQALQNVSFTYPQIMIPAKFQLLILWTAQFLAVFTKEMDKLLFVYSDIEFLSRLQNWNLT